MRSARIDGDAEPSVCRRCGAAVGKIVNIITGKTVRLRHECKKGAKRR